MIDTTAKPLIGIPTPRPVTVPAGSSDLVAVESVYAEILNRFDAFAKSAGLPLATESIIGTSLWVTSRLEWIRQRLALGVAGPQEIALASNLMEFAGTLATVYANWLDLNGAPAGILDPLFNAISPAPRSGTKNTVLQNVVATAGYLPAMVASGATGKVVPVGKTGVVVLALLAYFIFKGKK